MNGFLDYYTYNFRFTKDDIIVIPYYCNIVCGYVLLRERRVWEDMNGKQHIHCEGCCLCNCGVK